MTKKQQKTDLKNRWKEIDDLFLVEVVHTLHLRDKKVRNSIYEKKDDYLNLFRVFAEGMYLLKSGEKEIETHATNTILEQLPAWQKQKQGRGMVNTAGNMLSEMIDIDNQVKKNKILVKNNMLISLKNRLEAITTRRLDNEFLGEPDQEETVTSKQKINLAQINGVENLTENQKGILNAVLTTLHTRVNDFSDKKGRWDNFTKSENPDCTLVHIFNDPYTKAEKNMSRTTLLLSYILSDFGIAEGRSGEYMAARIVTQMKPSLGHSR